MTVLGESGALPPRRGLVVTFLRVLAKTLLFGIVGPIFLVVYFIADEPDIGWMLYTGIGITVADVVFAVGISYALVRGASKVERFEVSGVLAQADVTSQEQTGMSVNDQPMMVLALRIHGDGIATFDASKRVVVPLMFLSVVANRRLAVLVMPGTRDFFIDWQRSALLSGSVPALFTSVEDGREYDLTGQAAPLMQILTILKRNGIRGYGPIDIQNNPAVRAQVMDVVRHAASTADPAKTSVVSAATTGPTIAERLAELERLRAGKTITDDEYASMRVRILDSL